MRNNLSIGSSSTEAPYSGWFANWNNFWFGARDPVGLHTVRFLCGLLFLAWLLSYAGNLSAFFSLNGWFDRQAYIDARRLMERPDGAVPVPIDNAWSILYIAGDNATALTVMYVASLLVVGLFTLGVATRITAPLTWVVVVSFIANPIVSYNADYLLVILAFYMAVAYLLLGWWNGGLSSSEIILGPRSAWLLGGLFSRKESDLRLGNPPPSVAANLVMRLLQVHFALIIVSSLLHKMQIPDWWSGIAFWYPLHPPMETTREQVARLMQVGRPYLFFITLLQYAVLAWQFSYVFFAWRTGIWRVVLIAGAALGWIGSVWIFRQPIFGPVFFIASLCYLTSGEWRRFGAWVSEKVESMGSRSRAAVAPPKQKLRLSEARLVRE